MKKVIVVGANGFLGRGLCKKLASKGIAVVAFVAKGGDYSFAKSLHNVNCIEFDLSRIVDWDGIEEIKGADTMFYMAWAGVSSTYKNQVEIQVSNILYGIQVMEFAHRNGISRVIFPGSASEYACGNEVINGRSIPSPSDLYSASKVATKFLCQTYARQNGISLIWAVITSIYGPGRNDENLITYCIKTLLKGEKPSFTGLEQQWDYLYIDDLIDALVAVGEKGIGGKTYPIGSGENKQIVEYVKIIRDMIDPALPLGIGDIPYKNKTIDNQILDISELNEDTGFTARYSFESGIKLTIDYYKNAIK